MKYLCYTPNCEMHRIEFRFLCMPFYVAIFPTVHILCPLPCTLSHHQERYPNGPHATRLATRRPAAPLEARFATQVSTASRKRHM